MLVGVLVEIVGVVSTVEKEQMTVQCVKAMLLRLLHEIGIDADGNHHVSKAEFEMLIIKPEAAKIINDVGVDVVGLVDLTDYIFAEVSELSFSQFMDLILQLRGSNNATVRDIVDLRKFVLNSLENSLDEIKRLLTGLAGGGGA